MLKNLSFSILRIRDFRLLLLTRVFMIMALVSQAVIVGWQVYSLTKDPFLLGLAGLVEALPAIACAFFAGHIVDTGHPRKIYTWCIASLTLNTFGLLLVAGELIDVSKPHLLLCIFSGVFISGMARSFIMPSAFSILSRIVSRAETPAATAWLSSVAQIAIVSSPAIAGLVYGGYGPRGAWVLPVLLNCLAFLMICHIRTPHVRNNEKREPTLQSIRNGWLFIIQTPVLFSIMALDMFSVLFGGAISMLPAYADQVLHVGAEGLGALRAAPALGAVVTATTLALHPMKHITAVRLLWAITGFGICMIGFGLSTSFWLSMGFLAISGACDSISVLTRSTLMQLLTPDHMRGRVYGINSMFIISSNEIGAFESGVAARLFGLVPSVVIGGIMTLGIVAAVAFASPKLRKTDVSTEEGLG